MKKQLMVSVVVAISLICIVIGVTYAFFGNYFKSDAVGTNAGEINITYENDGEISGTLLPSVDYSNGIYTTSKIKLESNSLINEASIKLEIEEISNYLISDALNWTLFINGEVKGSSNFSSIPPDNIITLYDNYELNEDITEIKVYIWLDGDKSTNNMMNQLFKAKLYVETYKLTSNK